MKNLTNEEVKEELLKRFPEFANSDDRKEVFEEDGPYIYFNYFSNFLLRKITESGDSEIVKRAFDFINSIHSRENLSAEVWDLIGIELLETFEANDKARNLANRYLTGKALEAFQKQKGRPDE